MSKRKKNKKSLKTPMARFTAMSKMLGVIVIIITIAILIYAMNEMHLTGDLSALPTVIIGAFGMITAYISFYINMAKAEHIEDKKNAVKKELEIIRKNGITQEEQERVDELTSELEDMEVKLETLNTEEEINYMNQ